METAYQTLNTRLWKWLDRDISHLWKRWGVIKQTYGSCSYSSPGSEDGIMLTSLLQFQALDWENGYPESHLLGGQIVENRS